MNILAAAATETVSRILSLDSIKIDNEFKVLCPALTSDELRRLKENIIKDAEFREPLIVWRSENILVDGHNRLDVWRNLTDEQRQRIAEPRIKLKDFESREEAHNWIISNQLGRRNLDEKQKSYLIGKRYQSEKKNDKENLRRGAGSSDSPVRHSDGPGKTADQIASEVGKSPRQVERDAKFTAAVDTLVSNLGPDVKQELLTNKKASKSRVVEIAAIPADKQKAEYDRMLGRGEPSGGVTFDPSEWGGYETVDDPVTPHGVVTEYHVKEMQAPFNEVQKQATALKKAIQELPNGPGGAWCGPNAMNDIMTCYTNLINTINHRKPVVVCGHCNGQKCDKCYQTGALNKDLSQLFIEGQNATQGTTGSVRQAV
jgi:hypothetical protein